MHQVARSALGQFGVVQSSPDRIGGNERVALGNLLDGQPGGEIVQDYGYHHTSAGDAGVSDRHSDQRICAHASPSSIHLRNTGHVPLSPYQSSIDPCSSTSWPKPTCSAPREEGQSLSFLARRKQHIQQIRRIIARHRPPARIPGSPSDECSFGSSQWLRGSPNRPCGRTIRPAPAPFRRSPTDLVSVPS